MSTLYAQPQFIHHGAVDGVTGSCHEYRISDDYGLLIDCGLFQGAEVSASGSASSPGGSCGHHLSSAWAGARHRISRWFAASTPTH